MSQMNSEAVVASGSRLAVRWVKSAIGYNERQRRTLRALGFRRLGQTVEHEDSPQLRGMLESVKHLVEIRSL